jgi:hypothetical protein
VLQVFHIDVPKVDRDITYVAMISHTCCKRVFQMFHLFFRSMLQVCLFWVCYPNVTYVLQWIFKCFLDVFANVLDACFKCFIRLQTYVANISSECFKSRTPPGTSHAEN